MRIFLNIAIVIILALPAFAHESSKHNTNSKHFSYIVIDGNTINLSGEEITLYGIDAPERNQLCNDLSSKEWQCGMEAKKYLQRLIKKADIFCNYMGLDKFGRAASTCFSGGKDINQAMVHDGYAVADYFDTLEYIQDEEHAKKNRLGIWQGGFDLPWVWRDNQ